jgi:hypothetical protein
MAPITRTETGFGPGAEATSAPRVPGIPTFVTHGSGSISIAFASNGNDAVVTYAIRVKVDAELDGTYTTAGYVQTDGTVGVGEIFRTLAQWTTTIAVSGLTVYYAYTFAVKAKNEAAVESAYSAESRIMCTLPTLEYGLESGQTAREITSGNVKLDETTGLVLSGNEAAEATNDETWYYGAVTVTYKLLSYESDTAAIEGQFSEDGGSTWATATLTGGDGTTALTSSPTGVTHTITWDSYTDAGTSESQTDVKLRLRAQDAEGDWGPYTTSAEFIVYNRPGKPTVVNADSRSWDEDSTPVFNAVIPHFRGGTAIYPEIYIYEDTTGTPAVSGYPKKSVEDVTGWEYETSTNVWTQMLVSGIPSSAYNGVKRMRYTVQTAIAAGDYLVTMRAGEAQDLS